VASIAIFKENFYQEGLSRNKVTVLEGVVKTKIQTPDTNLPPDGGKFPPEIENTFGTELKSLACMPAPSSVPTPLAGSERNLGS
jgi:hypothetical protein